MQYKVIRENTPNEFELALRNAISFGWAVQSITFGDNNWFAIVVKS
jgi:hypothetical protein